MDNRNLIHVIMEYFKKYGQRCSLCRRLLDKNIITVANDHPKATKHSSNPDGPFQTDLNFCPYPCYGLFSVERNLVKRSALFWMFSYKSVYAVLSKDMAIMIGKHIIWDDPIVDLMIHVQVAREKLLDKIREQQIQN